MPCVYPTSWVSRIFVTSPVGALGDLVEFDTHAVGFGASELADD